MFGFTTNARVPQGPGAGAVTHIQPASMYGAGNQQPDALSKLLLILGMLVVLAVLFL